MFRLNLNFFLLIASCKYYFNTSYVSVKHYFALSVRDAMRISIHHMFRLNFNETFLMLPENNFISIHHMFRLNLSEAEFQLIVYEHFNTSYVSVKPNRAN